MITSINVLVRCDAAPAIGFGHVVRCLALASELRDSHGWRVAFAMVQGPLGVSQVEGQGFPVYQPLQPVAPGWGEGTWLQGLVANTAATVLVLDVRTDLTPVAVQAIRERGILIVTIDDLSERRLVADLTFYPPVPQVRRLDWAGFTGQLFAGWEWVVLRPEFAAVRQRYAIQQPSGTRLPRVLVTMGGSDPVGLTLQALQSLDVLEGDFATVVVLGAGFMHGAALESWLSSARRRYDLRYNVREMANLMAHADLAVASFGVTAYELAALGVPTIYLCLSEDHAESASALVDAGMAISLGVYGQVSADQIARAIAGWLDDSAARLAVGERARALVDGQGVCRIADSIALQSRF